MFTCSLNPGTYLLILELKHPTNVNVRSGKTFALQPGYYGYVGSALNGLKKRVERHLSQNKKLYWHIDYLVQIATVQLVILDEGNKSIECLIAQNLSQKHQYVSGFGSSDCKCKSHLFYTKDIKALVDSALNAFRYKGLEPVVKSVGNISITL